MKHELLRVLGTGISALLAAMVINTAVAQTTSPGPYYATPSWDQQLPTSTRFVVLSNWVDSNFPSGGAAVLDRETGLVWERAPLTTILTWGGAVDHCFALNVGNRGGWRLPKAQELRSLMDPTVASTPVLPAGHPFMNVQSIGYWSATLSAQQAGWAWIANFAGGGGTGPESNFAYVWCVRGGQAADSQ